MAVHNMVVEKNKEQVIEKLYEGKNKEQTIEKLYDQDMNGDLYILSHRKNVIFNVILSFFFCVFCAQVAEEIGEIITCHMNNVNVQKYKE